MPQATYVLEVNWSGDGSTWVEETSRILAVEWSRGRDYASQLTGRAIAGELTAHLLNPAGRFASFNATGALFGNILPARKVRWRTTAPTAATLWAGFLDEVKPGPRTRDGAATATLRALGPLSFVAEKDATVAMQTSLAEGTAIGHVLDDTAWPAGDRTIDVGQVVMNRWWADGDRALSHLRELEDTGFGFISESKDGKVVYEDVHHRLKSPHTTSQATFSDASGAALPYDGIEQLDPWKDVFNWFSAQVTYYTTQALAVLWALAGEVPVVGVSSSLTLWADYPTPDSPTQAFAVDAWTTPVASTDYIANSAADGSGSDVTGDVTVAVSKFGNRMKITFTNASASVPAFLTTVQARGTAIYRSDPIGVVTEDAASQTKYGKRSYPLQGEFYPSTPRARSFTEYGIARYKDALPLIAMWYQADASAAHLTQALTRDVSDRVTITANGTAESSAQLGFSRDFYIEAEQHRYDLSGHFVRYALSDATGDGFYWVLGVAGFTELGVTTRLGP